jgi:FlaG/FlaF family flagellin (archaellin)
VRGTLNGERAVAPVLGVVILVGVVAILSAVVAGYTLTQERGLQNPGPTATFEFELTEDDDGNDLLLVTHTAGDSIPLDRLLLAAEKPVDLGGSNNAPSQGYATTGEKLDEGDGQVGVGETWESGETIEVLAGDYGPGADELDGVTLRLVWNPREVDKDDQGGKAPSSVVGESSVVLFKHTV